MQRDMRSITPSGRTWFHPSSFAFPLLATLFFIFFFAASAPSPLFVVFQTRWAFSSGLLTVAFGIYAIILLVTLLVAGSLSDHLGRRPVIMAALMIQTIAMILFLTAHGISGLIAARIMQGLSMGIANGAMAAAVVEAAPAPRRWLGALVISVAPMAGLAAGAVSTGLSITLLSDPEGWIFGILAVLFPVGAACVFWIPETTKRRIGAWSSLVPRLSVATRARPVFVRGLPLLFVVWALCGLFIALAPSMMVQAFGIHNGLVNGLTVGVLCGVGAVMPTLLKSVRPATASLFGLSGVSVGILLLLASLETNSVALFFLGTAIAGAGSGTAFSAHVQTLVPLADGHERAELFAALFVVTYLSLSLPPIIAGFLIASFGLLQTVHGYLSLMLAVSLAGTWLQVVASRR